MAAAHPPAVDIVVRFNSSSADKTVRIDTPASTSIVSVKQRLRELLDPPSSLARLRLIHAGRVLSDHAAVSKSLKIPQPPPTDHNAGASAKAKGKQPVRDVPRVYIHCSVGDALAPNELSAETRAAQDADAALLSQDADSTAPAEERQSSDGKTTTAAPRGFDRLLSAGFNASEVTALRAQFLAIQAHSHTPDTMPTGQELLALEEQWLDNGSSSDGNTMGEGGGFASDDAGGLEDMLYGNLIGFFWPIGAMCWLLREEGVWSRRRQIAVLSGFLVNCMFGALRFI